MQICSTAEIAVEQHRAKGSNADERRVRMMYSYESVWSDGSTNMIFPLNMVRVRSFPQNVATSGVCTAKTML